MRAGEGAAEVDGVSVSGLLVVGEGIEMERAEGPGTAMEEGRGTGCVIVAGVVPLVLTTGDDGPSDAAAADGP